MDCQTHIHQCTIQYYIKNDTSVQKYGVSKWNGIKAFWNRREWNKEITKVNKNETKCNDYQLAALVYSIFLKANWLKYCNDIFRQMKDNSSAINLTARPCTTFFKSWARRSSCLDLKGTMRRVFPKALLLPYRSWFDWFKSLQFRIIFSYSGGLDTKNHQTGRKSVYTKYKGRYWRDCKTYQATL